MIQMDFLSTLKQFNAINAIQNGLPQTDISGCFFHLLSNLLKFIRTCWIERTLPERTPIWFAVTYDCCFSLRAHTGFDNSFDELCVSIRNQYDGDADEVLNYFEHTYIGCFCRKTPDALLYFLSSYGARLNDLLKCFHEQIIKSRLGITVSKQMFHPLTQRSGSF